MKLFPQDNDVIIYETGFDDDLLSREGISKQLSDLVEKVEDPIVIALDDKWGSGKSYFLKRWVAAHGAENEGTATTVYFDAFENDYLSEPLLSIISAVSERIPNAQKDTVQKLKDVGTKLVKPALGIALSLATFGAKQHLDDLGDVVVDAVGSEARSAVPDIWQVEKDRKDAMKAFRELLVELTSKTNAPIVIVVDELDRCRPDFALSVLEIIKHFFSVPKVHFVLGINGSALENSVRSRYGADIDAESYLRKFISVSFSLPRLLGQNRDVHTVLSYAFQLSAIMGLPEKVSSRCIDLLKCVCIENDVSLRDVGKIMSKIALLPTEVSEKNWPEGRIDTLCILLVSSIVNPKINQDFISGNATTKDLMVFVGATKINTSDRTDEGDRNPDYDDNVTIWLATMLFLTAQEELVNMVRIPEQIRSGIGNRFYSFETIGQPTPSASRIQRDWVDVFKI